MMKRLYDQHEINEAFQLFNAWQDPALPQRQWDVIKKERELLYQNKWREVTPFRALDDALRAVDVPNTPETTVLDIGAGSAIYSEMIRRAGINWTYRAADYSIAFKEFASEKYPDVPYDI
jgi:2-polyprenyl-3-methyl-5-hydroxy-6-metoxy-1,4-benzoquinol methylase